MLAGMVSGVRVAAAAGSATLAGAARVGETVATVPRRMLGLLGEAEDLIPRVRVLLADIAEVSGQARAATAAAADTVAQANALIHGIQATAADAAAVTAAAAAVLTRAGELNVEAAAVLGCAGRSADTTQELLARYAPPAARAAPLVEELLGAMSAAHVDAVLTLLGELPVLTDQLRRDVLPVLATLDRVGPDLTDLLAVTHDLHHAIGGMPGFGFFKKRGEERLDDTDPSPQPEPPAEPKPQPSDRHDGGAGAPAQDPAAGRARAGTTRSARSRGRPDSHPHRLSDEPHQARRRFLRRQARGSTPAEAPGLYPGASPVSRQSSPA